MNPGEHIQTLMYVMSKRRWEFPFDIRIHGRDACTLTNALAKDGQRSCILVPVDFVALMQRFVGKYWERGCGMRYDLETHLASTSTALFARRNIANVWSNMDNHDNIKHIEPPNNRSHITSVCCYPAKDDRKSPTAIATFANLLFIDFEGWYGGRWQGQGVPPCIDQVTKLVQHSNYGAVHIAHMDLNEARQTELVKKWEDPTEREDLWYDLYTCLLRALSDSDDHLFVRLQDVNGIVIHADLTQLWKVSGCLALFFSFLRDLRNKSIFHGVIMCAGVGNGIEAGQFQYIMQMGADWVFTYDHCSRTEEDEEKPPVSRTFNRFMKDLSRLQRYSPSLARAIYEGRVPVAWRLLANGADPNQIHPCTGPWSALHWAQVRHTVPLRDSILTKLRDAILHEFSGKAVGTQYPRCGVRKGVLVEQEGSSER